MLDAQAMTPRSPLEELAEIEREMRDEARRWRASPPYEAIDMVNGATVDTWAARLAAARGAIAEERTALFNDLGRARDWFSKIASELGHSAQDCNDEAYVCEEARERMRTNNAGPTEER